MLAHHPNRLAEIEGSKHTASRVKRCDENKQMKSISSRDDTQRRTKRTLRSTLLPARSQVAAVARHLPGASSPGEQRLCQDGTWIDVERPRRAPPSRSAPCGPRGKPKQAVREQACAGVTSRRDHVNRLLCKQRAREDAEAALARPWQGPASSGLGASATPPASSFASPRRTWPTTGAACSCTQPRRTSRKWSSPVTIPTGVLHARSSPGLPRKGFTAKRFQ